MGHKCPKTCRDDPIDVGTPPLVDGHWIPDVTMLNHMAQDGMDTGSNPWPPMLSDELCEEMNVQGGKRNDENKRALDAISFCVVENANKNTMTKVLCMVYTMQESHATKICAICETWASHCDGFLAFSTESGPRIPAISIAHDGPCNLNHMEICGKRFDQYGNLCTTIM